MHTVRKEKIECKERGGEEKEQKRGTEYIQYVMGNGYFYLFVPFIRTYTFDASCLPFKHILTDDHECTRKA